MKKICKKSMKFKKYKEVQTTSTGKGGKEKNYQLHAKSRIFCLQLSEFRTSLFQLSSKFQQFFSRNFFMICCNDEANVCRFLYWFIYWLVAQSVALCFTQTFLDLWEPPILKLLICLCLTILTFCIHFCLFVF